MSTASRAASSFPVRLEKNGGSLGLSLKKPARENVRGLLISEVLPDGLLASHNTTQIKARKWADVVLPGMRIVAVNGEDDPTNMIQAIRASDTVVLNVRRRDGQLQPAPWHSEAKRLLAERVADLIRESKDSLTSENCDWEAATRSLGADAVQEFQQALLQAEHAVPISYEAKSSPSRPPAAESTPSRPTEDDLVSEESC